MMHTCTCGECGGKFRSPLSEENQKRSWYPHGKNGAGACWCQPCKDALYARLKEERKRQLDTMPRCEVDGCKRRATYTVAGCVGMCGRHMKTAARAHDRAMGSLPGGMGLFMPVNYGRDDLLRMATG